jgi:tRNA(adenine34) deaminase
MIEDEKWMKIAITQANLAQSEGEIPIGAVIIKNEIIIAKAHNQPILKNDPTAHAEIQVIRKAGAKENNYRLIDTTLYVTLEPCAMCLGAIMHARIARIVFGAYDYKTGVCGSCADLRNKKFFHHEIKITGGILEKDCSKLLKSFFKLRR